MQKDQKGKKLDNIFYNLNPLAHDKKKTFLRFISWGTTKLLTTLLISHFIIFRIKDNYKIEYQISMNMGKFEKKLKLTFKTLIS